INSILREASFAEKPGAREIVHGKINARSDGRKCDAFAGDFVQAPDDVRSQATDADFIANFGIELRQQSGLDQGTAIGVAEIEGARDGVGFKLAIERKSAAQCARNGETRAAGAR